MKVDSIKANDRFAILLLSDLSIVNDLGQLPSYIHPNHLGYDSNFIQFLNAFHRTRTLRGFNRKWGLTLPEEEVFCAGSIFIYQATKPILENDILALEWNGVGNRRVEGLGRIVIIPEIDVTDSILRKGKTAEVHPKRTISPEAKDENFELIIKTFLTNLLRERLTRKVRRQISRINLINITQTSQISRIRAVLRSCQAVGSFEPLRLFLENAREPAQKALRNTILQPGSTSLWEWLEKFMKNDLIRTFRQEIGWEEGELPSLGEYKAEFSKELSLEFSIQLLDMTLGRTMASLRHRIG